MSGRRLTALPDRCSSCGAEILWARTDKGFWMPVDPRPSAEGSLLLTWQDGSATVRVVAPGGQVTRHRPHFATCPDAESWRWR